MAEDQVSCLKVCFKCGVLKDISEFYKHPRMADGHLGKCKECTKQDNSENYHRNREYYAEYERMRYKEPNRRAYVLERQRNLRKRRPIRYHAASAVSNAVRDGRLARCPCEKCGTEPAQAHHEDYLKPLDIIWLCRSCHLEVHGKKAYVFRSGS